MWLGRRTHSGQLAGLFSAKIVMNGASKSSLIISELKILSAQSYAAALKLDSRLILPAALRSFQ